MLRKLIIIGVAISSFVLFGLVSETMADEAKKEMKNEPAKEETNNMPQVLMKTSLGSITIELYPDKAPIGVKNFLRYVDEKFYNGTIFHRVISGFMIQGGGFDQNLVQKKPHEPIKNEADNGLKNDRGTVAYARTNVVDSATCQFFINVVDNSFLNHRAKTPQDYGYCVFGKVIAGMDIVDKIKAVPKGTKGGMQDVPVKPVEIQSVERIEK
ncbi:peptidyl-prolyl cis-trans isomerase [bacterium]|nr:peptidyl-prolyl cis-trans isomerase [bacterium]